MQITTSIILIAVLAPMSLFWSPPAARAEEFVIGGTRADRGVSISNTTGGGFVITGTTASSGAGGEDAWFVRLDPKGEVLWETAVGAEGDDAAWAIHQKPDGALVAVGFSTGTGSGGLDCALFAFDPEGKHLWSKTYGGSSDDRCWAMTPTADGGFVLAGETSSTGAGKRDCLLVRTNGAGDEIWSRTYGGVDDDRCFSVVAASDGGFVIAGQSFTYGAGNRDAWVVKTDSKGTLLWSKTHGGEASDVAHSVVADGGGNYLVTGYTTSLADSPDDPMILKFSDDGSLLWSRVLALDGHNRAITGSLTKDGGLCLAGLTVGGDPRIKAALLIKIDAEGRVLWTKNAAPTTYGESFGYGVTATPNGGCALTGHTTKGSSGGLDLLVATADADGR